MQDLEAKPEVQPQQQQGIVKEVALKSSEVEEDDPVLENTIILLQQLFGKIQLINNQIEQQNVENNELLINEQDNGLGQTLQDDIKLCREQIGKLEKSSNLDKYKYKAATYRQQLQNEINKNGQLMQSKIKENYNYKIQLLRKSEIKVKDSEVELEEQKVSQASKKKSQKDNYYSVAQPEESLKTPLTANQQLQENLQLSENELKWKSELQVGQAYSEKFIQEQEKTLNNQKDEQLKQCNDYIQKLNEILNDIAINQLSANEVENIVNVIQQKNLKQSEAGTLTDDPMIAKVRFIILVVSLTLIVLMGIGVGIYMILKK